jgi:large subunit ribosomal protein L22
MHAHVSSARLAPLKANLVAKMVRGLPVPEAVELLRKTHKKAARLLEDVLRSAIANAEHNFKQDAQSMVLKSVVVNQGTHYRRGTPMARGRVRPLKKYLCHVTITLGYPGETPRPLSRREKQQQAASAPKAEVKSAPKKAPTKKTSSATSSSK